MENVVDTAKLNGRFELIERICNERAGRAHWLDCGYTERIFTSFASD